MEAGVFTSECLLAYLPSVPFSKRHWNQTLLPFQEKHQRKGSCCSSGSDREGLEWRVNQGVQSR